MPTEVSARSGVCQEYQQLLSNCQRALASWQQQSACVSRHIFSRQKAGPELKRRQSEYMRAYASLEQHERDCPHCQFVSKIAGLDFESMSSALDFYRRSS